MKKEIFLTVLFLYFLFFLNTAKAQRFKAGLSAGLTATDVAGADTRDGDNDFHKLGFTVGGIVNTRLNEKNVFQFEINYIQKGSMQPPDSLNNGYFKLAIDYMEVPMLLKHRIHFNIRKKPINGFDLEGGMSIGRMIRYTMVNETNYLQTVDLSKINKTDVSIFAGIDYNFSSNFYFCLRYGNSVIPTIKRNSVPLFLYRYTFNQGNNMVFQFAFKLIFGSTENKEQADQAVE